jgi:hypothetical protein
MVIQKAILSCLSIDSPKRDASREWRGQRFIHAAEAVDKALNGPAEKIE